jgi:hypothetical protein
MYPETIIATSTEVSTSPQVFSTQYNLQLGTDPVTYTGIITLSFVGGLIIGLVIILLLEGIDFLREK